MTFSTGSSLSQRDMGFFSQGLTGVFRQADKTFSTPSTHSSRWTAVLYLILVNLTVFIIVTPQRKHPLLRQPFVASGTYRKESTGLPLLFRQAYYYCDILILFYFTLNTYLLPFQYLF
jgi:hypothetical protein